eukprot:TRINITY_DN7445_c0_g1_i1.p1 TRINITY_DN7445_c0_g1~~TRINITY_DN7445_c0_g1_i1.p1  ORF type:complete len:286 (-),score=43.27 TRINITY_DN7445_c0_g1_i1:55-912(-)
MLNVEPFKNIAEYLSEQGYAVLRYDKRGCSRTNSKGYCTYSLCNDVPNPNCYNETAATQYDFITDIINAAIFLSKSGYSLPGITLMGHSEGAGMVPHAANMLPDGLVTDLVLLMGAGLNYDTMVNLEILQSNAAPIGQLAEVCYGEGYKQAAETLLQLVLKQNVEEVFWSNLTLQLRQQKFGDDQPVYGSLTAKFFYSEFALFDQDKLRAAISNFKGRILSINSPQDPLITPENYTVLHLMLKYNSPNSTALEIPDLLHFMVPSNFTSSKVPQRLLDPVTNFLSS